MTDTAGEEQDGDDESQLRKRRGIERVAVTEADEACVFFLDDLLTEIFEAMRVCTENATLFTMTARRLCVQLFESLDMSELKPSQALDQFPGGCRARRSNLAQRDVSCGNLPVDGSKCPLPPPVVLSMEEANECWMRGENLPQALEIDRQVPGQVGTKATSSASERGITRKVLLQMTRPLRHDSRWKTVQHKVLADADPNWTRNNAIRRSTRSRGPEINAGLDATAFATIFSLGTPRQLPSHELLRRQDLLAQVERAAARQTIASKIALMCSTTSPLCDSEPLNSSLKAEYQVIYASDVAKSVESTGGESVSPTRPPHSRKRAVNPRSKFEFERQSLPFVISDHVQEKHDQGCAAMCSPIKHRCLFLLPESPRPEPLMPTLPLLDSSSLAVGVSAVVSGIVKRSRSSRLQLDNYRPEANGLNHSDPLSGDIGRLPFSPVQTAAIRKNDSDRLPILPFVSPVQAHPHRKHVTLRFQEDHDTKVSITTISPKPHIRQRPVAKVKQQVWEATNPSPPRARNYHFVSGKSFRKIHYFQDKGDDPSSAKYVKQGEHENVTFQPLAAPRRDDLPMCNPE